MRFVAVSCALALLSARLQALAPSHPHRHFPAGRRGPAPLHAKVGFGKYSGDSYQDVWEKDPGYIQWVARTPSGKSAHLKFQSWIRRKAAGLDGDESMGGGQAILFDSAVKAANVVASSSDGDRNYGSLKNFWMARTGDRWPTTCCYSGCKNSPTLGGHVWIKGEKEPQIVPICGSCNSRYVSRSCCQSAHGGEPLTHSRHTPLAIRRALDWSGNYAASLN